MEKQNINSCISLYEDSNPNQEYSLLYVSAGPEDRLLSELGEELITDGDISSMVHNYNENGCIYRRGSAVIKIKNASYTIVQRIADKEVVNAEVFTTIIEDAKMDKVLEMAIERQNGTGEYMLTKYPYVRKIKL